MARVKRGVVAHAKHKKVLEQANIDPNIRAKARLT